MKYITLTRIMCTLNSPRLLTTLLLTSHRVVLPNRRHITHLVKSITVRTCVGIYPKLREEHPMLWRNAPAEGVNITVDYLDTWLNRSGKPEKTIVALHGTADTYATFTKIIQYFEHSQVRVVAPNLPVFQDTRNTGGVFWHTANERGCLLKDILLKLNIDTVNCLVSHSIAAQVIGYLWEQPGNIDIKTVAMIAPQPMWFFPLNESEINILRRIYLFPTSKLWAKFLELCNLHKHPRVPFKFTHIDQFLLMNTFLFDLKSPDDFERRIRLWMELNRPSILLYGSNEKIITPKGIAKLKDILGITPDKEICLDTSKNSPAQMAAPAANGTTSYTFLDAGHFPHTKGPFINRLIEDLLRLSSK